MFHGITFTSDRVGIKAFRTSDLGDVDVLPKEKELVFFDESGDEDVQCAIRVIQSNVQFGVSNKVLICLGVLQGTLGCIISIDNMEMAQIKTSKDHLLVEVPQRHLRRAFSCSDYVTIISGEHQGCEGFITELYGELVMLYMPVRELGPQNPVGKEVFEPALAILHMSDLHSFKLNRHISIGRTMSTHLMLNCG
jgi:transcription antitermination factor NusG